MPRLLAQALLFGRQTDREARLEVMSIAGDEIEAVTTNWSTMLRESRRAQSRRKRSPATGRPVRNLLRSAWQPPRDATAEQLRPMMEQHQRDAILDRWPDLKLGAFSMAVRRARRPATRRSACELLAAIMVLEHWSQRLPGEMDFNELRTALGLPVLGPVDPRQHSVPGIAGWRGWIA